MSARRFQIRAGATSAAPAAHPKGAAIKARLPLVLSTSALLVAVLGSTPLGQAGAGAVLQVVPRAKTANFAVNAGKLNGRRSSPNPRPGQIPVVGADGKLAAAIGAVGAAGPAGPPGVSGYQMIERQFAVGGNTAEFNMDCPSGKKVLGAGHFFRRQDSLQLVLFESRPISDSTWRFNIQNRTSDRREGQSGYIICANVSS
jgi:hypothetical protein